MKYARLGRSGLIVSRLCFGTLSFGKGHTAHDMMHKVDEPLAARLVGEAIDAGINYFNSADVYAEGHSEAMLGQALGTRRKDVVICTKVGLRNGEALGDQGLSRRHILASVEASLARLKTDWIDVLVLHCTDPHTPLEETLDTLNQLIGSGKVRYIGVSNWPAWLTAKAVALQNARGWEAIRAAEVYYSLVGRDIEHEIVPMAGDAGIGLQVWSPLAGGLLSGRGSGDSVNAGDKRVSNHDFLPIDRSQATVLLDYMETIAREIGASVAQLAIAWLLTKPAVSSVIIGTSSSAQLADNLGASGLILDPSITGQLDVLTAPVPTYPGWYARLSADALVNSVL